jgi:lipopolysaccharide transport system ATP-binding protein
MSSKDVAVSVRGLSKAYTIAHNAPKHTMVGEMLMHRLKHPFERPKKETFWALKDVEFDIMKGDVVGIIGRNGAGKSTLLKILSRITKPTTGQIDLYGRVGSLLEVGTGFHPELTGRENIYLNGAILGMRKREIERQFDAIVDFAEVEQFLDTPVKRYSSGMYVRLAFAVAAHLNPEILIVDEVLAVGDAEFQKKCLGKMQDVAQSGRTVLFVSHNLDAIRMLCSSVLFLQQGKLAFSGGILEGLTTYSQGKTPTHNKRWKRPEQSGSSSLVINEISAELLSHDRTSILSVLLHLTSLSAHKPAFVALDISNETGTVLMQALPSLTGFITSETDTHLFEMKIELPPLIPGRYSISSWVGSHNSETLDEIQECVSFDIEMSPTPGRTFPHTSDHGYIVPFCSVEEVICKSDVSYQ